MSRLFSNFILCHYFNNYSIRDPFGISLLWIMTMISPFWISHKLKTLTFGMTSLIAMSAFVGRFVNNIRGFKMIRPHLILLVLRRLFLVRPIPSHHRGSFRVFKLTF